MSASPCESAPAPGPPSAELTGAVRFEADQGPRHPWNAVVGASAALHRRLELFAE